MGFVKRFSVPQSILNRDLWFLIILGAYTAPKRHSSFRGRGTVKSWYTSPFEDSFLDNSATMTTTGATSRPRNCRTLPALAAINGKESSLMTQSACFSGQMVDSGFADPWMHQTNAAAKWILDLTRALCSPLFCMSIKLLRPTISHLYSPLVLFELQI